MAQACDGYTKTSLMGIKYFIQQFSQGNWYEERHAPEQSQRNPDAQKSMRQVEQEISIPGNQGSLVPLPRVKRNPHWITSDLIPDDGFVIKLFREYRSIQKTTYDAGNMHNMFNLKDCRPIIKSNGQRVMYPECNPTTVQTGGTQNFNMLQQQNMHQAERTREVFQNCSDFGSTFKSHPETHQKFYGITSYASSFQNPKGFTVNDIQAEQNKKPATYASGIRERLPEHQGLQMTSIITGEKFRDLNDPKDNTSIQRAWLPTNDPGITQATKAMERNTQMLEKSQQKPSNLLQTFRQSNNQNLDYDIATSIPIGDGMYNLQRKYDNPGEFRHVRTDVTIIRNKPLTKK